MTSGAVSAGVAEQNVGALFAVDLVVAGVAPQGVVAGATPEVVVAGAAAYDVIAAAGQEVDEQAAVQVEESALGLAPG